MDEEPRGVVQEADEVASGAILLVAALSVVVALLAIGWAYLEVRRGFGPDGPPLVQRPAATELRVGLLQTQIEPDWEPPETPAPVTDAGGFGWTDRERREVSLPIEEAMRLVVEGFAP